MTTTKRWPSRTFLKYLVLQIPGWLLLLAIVLYLRLQAELSTLLVGLWIGKDLLLFRFLRRAYEGDPRVGAELLVGMRGVVVTRSLAPEGYIRVHGELWRAETQARGTRLMEGTIVTVTAGHCLTLTVERD